MKRLIFITLLSTLLFPSCQRESVPEFTPPDATGRVPLLLLAEGAGFTDGLETKAGVAPTTSANLSSFFASATTGTAGAEVSAWTSTEFTKQDGAYTGGKYWPLSNPGYHFYASNIPLTFQAAGTTIQPANDTDVVCAYVSSSSYKTANILVFKHIFARLGTLAVNAQDGYEISNVSITITPKTGGTYNLRIGDARYDGTGWSALTAGAPVELTTGSPGTKNNDLYLVPGRYTMTATWTATRGEYVETFTGKTTDVDLTGGKINNLSTTLGGRATPLQFNMSVAEWGNTSSSITFPMS